MHVMTTTLSEAMMNVQGRKTLGKNADEMVLVR